MSPVHPVTLSAHTLYTPRPIATAGVSFPRSLTELVEKLAEHNHDVWAQQRISEGWRLGPARDDARKEHPCLVPYGELPDGEREYDRRTTVEILKAVLALGYRIEDPPDLCNDTAAGRGSGSNR